MKSVLEKLFAVRFELTVNTESILVQFFAWRADASVGGWIEDETPGAVADAASVAVDDEAPVGRAGDAVAVLVEGVAGRAHALLVLVQDQAFAGWTRFHWKEILFQLI